MKEGENPDDFTEEEIEARAIDFNQRNRNINILLFTAFTIGLTAKCLSY